LVTDPLTVPAPWPGRMALLMDEAWVGMGTGRSIRSATPVLEVMTSGRNPVGRETSTPGVGPKA
jgi:hypothetical protein